MSFSHAVVRTDHRAAEVTQFDDDRVVTKKLQAHSHDTGPRNSAVRDEHEFFAAVCDALDGIASVLVTGAHKPLDDFRHYVEKHRPQLAQHLLGFEVVDHPSENELVAQARKFFAARGRGLA